MQRNVMVTGANRGLGLEFVRLWLEAGNRVYALARRPQSSAGLEALRARFGETLAVQSCDVADDASVRSAADAVASGWERVDVLLNNAGTYGQRAASLESIDFDDVRRVFDTNTLGPLRLSRALLPQLRRGVEPRIVHITSLMGSIQDNEGGGSYAYRMSKAALNMASCNLAHELRGDGIISAVLHPGWVRTDMGGSSAPLEIDDAVRAMIRTIEGLDTTRSGGFFDRNGKRLPW